jgi:hypothetical protein
MNEKNFLIEDGVIVEYNGIGGEVTIPKGVIAIGEDAFGCHSEITSVVIPESVTVIGNGAFSGCVGVAYYDFAQCTSVPTLLNTNAFSSIASDCKIVIPDSLYEEWTVATNWATYEAKIVKASEFNV